jgi:hypothetical protein
MEGKQKLMEEKLEALLRWRGRISLGQGFLIVGVIIFGLSGLILFLQFTRGHPAFGFLAGLLTFGVFVGIGVIAFGGVFWMIGKSRYTTLKSFVTSTDEGRKETARFLSDLLGKDTEDKKKIVNVIDVLGDIGEKQMVEFIIPALKDEDRFVRHAAVESLGKVGDADAIGPLVCTLIEEQEDFALRGKVAKALDKLAWKPQTDVERAWYLIARERWIEVADLGGSAIEALVIVLRDNNWGLRCQAVRALGMTGDAKAVGPLTHALQDENYNVRDEARKALNKIQGK